MGRDRARRSPKKRGKFHTTLQSGHLLYHSEANNGQAGVGFLINKKWKDNITRVSSGTHNFRRKQGGDGHGEALMETLKTKLTTS